ncbi:MAG: hypothetical protein J2P25_01365 [Nocardiopsaceae bacterium]|nr:hypothetical protein [Nocardiopsaceae bacterium]
MPEQHELEYIGTARSGADIWQCPHCEHRMLTRWWPSFQAEVLSEGDRGVAHSGNLGAPMAGRQALRGPAAPLTAGERNWLDSLGIDWDANGSGRGESAA